MTPSELHTFEQFTRPLIGLPVSHIWTGYGSALFLEFGALTTRTRRDGSVGNPQGAMTFAVERSWRIEGKRRVWCGSFSEADRWQRVLALLKDSTITDIKMFGRIGEVDLGFSNGLHLLSFMTEFGDPEWSLMNQEHIYLSVVAGRLHFDLRNQLQKVTSHA